MVLFANDKTLRKIAKVMLALHYGATTVDQCVRIDYIDISRCVYECQ